MSAAVVVAAHGHGDGSHTNRLVEGLAARAAELAGSPEWGVAFHRGTPHFSRALRGLAASDVVVVPLMTADGYYSRVVLRRELRPEGRSVRVTDPVGTSPWLPGLVRRRVFEICGLCDFNPSETSVLLVGHGTARHPESRRSTEWLASSLGDGTLEVRLALLDEEPTPEVARASLKGRNQVIIPFLVGPGEHATQDLPRRLGTPMGLHDRTFLDRPLGHDPSLAELIAERATGRLPGPLATHLTEGEKPWSIS